MNEPWNIKKDDIRKADSLPTFIIFCEDEVSEPIYFKYFETSLIKVNPIKKQKSKVENVVNAICHCDETGITDTQKGLLLLNNKDTQVWCVFDRDKEKDSSINKGNASFDAAIKTAVKTGIKLAWSNDSFELWILLHFEDINILNSDYKHRATYYDRLTSIFKTLPSPNSDLTKALSHPTFNYKQDLKRETNFRNIVRSEIIGKTKDAIKRAKDISKHFDGKEIPIHSLSPCTLVYQLVEELLKYGKKKI